MHERYQIIDDQLWKDKGVRKVPVQNYFVYFVISEPDKSVKILAVIYAGRDQQQAMNAANRITGKD